MKENILHNNCSEIIFTRKKHLGIITLNRPKSYNALNKPMLEALEKQLLTWEKDSTLHAVIITSNSQVFCAGGDLKELYFARGDLTQQVNVFRNEYILNRLIANYSKPYIAWMNGITFGGGVGISLHGSHTVATENFIFAMPETKIGFFPDVGASYLFAKCPAKYGEYLGLSGQRLNATTTKSLNLVKYNIQQAQFEHIINALLEEDLSHDAHARVSNCLQTYESTNPQDLDLKLQDDITTCFQYTSMEEIMCCLAEHNTLWSNNTYKDLANYSPISLKVTLKQLITCKNKSLDQCLEIDLILATNFLRGDNFYEGIRAAVIDKDQKPLWNPNKLEAVSNEYVNNYFENI